MLIYRFVRADSISFAQQIQRDKVPNNAPYLVWGSKQLNLAFSTIYSQYTGNLLLEIYVNILAFDYQFKIFFIMF